MCVFACLSDACQFAPCQRPLLMRKVHSWVVLFDLSRSFYTFPFRVRIVDERARIRRRGRTSVKRTLSPPRVAERHRVRAHGRHRVDEEPLLAESQRPASKRRKRKGSTSGPGNNAPPAPSKKRSPGPNFSLASQVSNNKRSCISLDRCSSARADIVREAKRANCVSFPFVSTR